VAARAHPDQRPEYATKKAVDVILTAKVSPARRRCVNTGASIQKRPTVAKRRWALRQPNFEKRNGAASADFLNTVVPTAADLAADSPAA